MLDNRDPFSVLPQLGEEASDLRARFNEICDGGTSAADATLADIQIDNLARAIGEGIPLASYALGIAAVQRVLRGEGK